MTVSVGGEPWSLQLARDWYDETRRLAGDFDLAGGPAWDGLAEEQRLHLQAVALRLFQPLSFVSELELSADGYGSIETGSVQVKVTMAMSKPMIEQSS